MRTTWGLVKRHVKSAALPVFPPPLIMGREVDLGDGLFVAGDHREAPGHPRERCARVAGPPPPCSRSSACPRSPQPSYCWPRDAAGPEGALGGRSGELAVHSGTSPILVRRSSRSSTVVGALVGECRRPALPASRGRVGAIGASSSRSAPSPVIAAAAASATAGLGAEAADQSRRERRGRRARAAGWQRRAGAVIEVRQGPALEVRDLPDRSVDGVLGHLAVGGQLAADHRHHPATPRRARRACGTGRRWSVKVSSSGRSPAYAPTASSRYRTSFMQDAVDHLGAGVDVSSGAEGTSGISPSTSSSVRPT